jgi:hypothetical protein
VAGLLFGVGIVNKEIGTKPKTRGTKINIYDAVFRKNGSISAKSLNNLTHQVKIPNTFMQRVEVYHFFHEPLLWHPAPTYIAGRVW